MKVAVHALVSFNSALYVWILLKCLFHEHISRYKNSGRKFLVRIPAIFGFVLFLGAMKKDNGA